MGHTKAIQRDKVKKGKTMKTQKSKTEEKKPHKMENQEKKIQEINTQQKEPQEKEPEKNFFNCSAEELRKKIDDWQKREKKAEAEAKEADDKSFPAVESEASKPWYHSDDSIFTHYKPKELVYRYPDEEFDLQTYLERRRKEIQRRYEENCKTDVNVGMPERIRDCDLEDLEQLTKYLESTAGQAALKEGLHFTPIDNPKPFFYE